MSEFDSFFQEVSDETAKAAKPLQPAATTPTPGNEFSSFFQDVQDEQGARLAGALQAVQSTDPERYAKATKLAGFSGLPTDVVDRNLDVVERQHRMATARSALADFPTLAKWVTEGDNARFVKEDELRALSGIPWFMAAGKQAYEAGDRGTESAQIGWLQMIGKATPEQIQRADDLDAQNTERSFGADSWLEQGWTALAQNAPNLIYYAQSAIKGTLAGASVGAAAGAAGFGAGAVPGAGIGAIIGGQAAGLKSIYELEAGSAFREYMGYKDENGQPMDQTTAKIAASIVGGVNAGLEAFGLKETFGKIPGVDRLFSAVTRDGIGKALQNGTFRQILTKAAKDIGIGFTTEVTTEGLQELTTAVAGEIAKRTQDGQFPLATVDDVAERVMGVMGDTAKMMTILAPATIGPSIIRDVRAARAAEADAVTLQDAQEAMQSPDMQALVKRSPEKARDAINAHLSGTGTDNVIIPAQALVELYQTQGRDPFEFEDVIPGWRDDLAEALARGGDVEVSRGDYLARIAADKQVADALLPHVRTRDMGMSLTEAQEAFSDVQQAEWDKFLAEEAQAAQAAQAAAEPAQRVFDDIREKQVAAGVAPDVANQNATLWQAFFRTMAERARMDPFALYNQFAPNVQRAMPAELAYQPTDRLDLILDDLRAGKDTAAARRVETAKGPSLLQFIAGRGGMVDSGGELAARNLDKRYLAKGDDAAAQGLRLDDTALAAWEAGYLPGQERASIDDLLAAIDEEQAGSKRFSEKNGTAVDAHDETLVAWSKMLDDLGVNIGAHTNEEVRQALAQATNTDPETAALYQAAFHGTRHLFDTFSTDHIGSGEGAQAYGWGLYFASSKDVAEWYRENLAGRSTVELGGVALDPYDPLPKKEGAEPELLTKLRPKLKWPEGAKRKDGSAMPPSFFEKNDAWLASALLHELREMIAEVGGSTPPSEYFAQRRKFLDQKAAEQADERDYADFLVHRAILDALEGEGVKQAKPGRLFHVDVPDDAELLDYDAPLSEQPPAIRERLASLGFTVKPLPKIDDPELAAIVKAALKQSENDPDQVGLIVDNDAQLYGRAQKLMDRMGEKNSGDALLAALTEDADVDLDDGMSPGEFIDAMSRDYRYALMDQQKLTGQAIYNQLSQRLGQEKLGENADPDAIVTARDDRAASEALAALGIPGHRYTGHESQSTNYVIYDAARVAVREFFQGDGKDDLGGAKGDTKRGSIQFQSGRVVINLFEKADLSTFLHESGHFFLEVLKQVAETPNAPPELRADWETVKAELGIGDGAIPREAHETWARSFEAYLMEGKPPSPELAGIFQRFKSWLQAIYRQVSRLGVNVSPKVRDVMDRMLASDQEIEAARREAEFRPMFKTPQDGGMTQAEYDAYSGMAQAAVDQAKTEFEARLMAEVKRETTREWREQRTAVRAEVVAELNKMRVYQAAHYLRKGEFLDGSETVGIGQMRLDKQILVDMFGPSVLSRLPRGVPPIYTAKDGVHPDIVAELFGYGSGDEMVRDLLSAPSYAQAVKAETDKRMRERHGDLMSNMDQRATEALAAMHSDQRGLFLATELRVLARRAGMRGLTTPASVASRMAKEMVGGKKIGQVRMSFYAAAERKAAREAERAMLEGQFDVAADAKRRQLLNHYLAMEAKNAAEDVRKARDYLARFAGTKRPPGVDPEYVDQIQGILERFDLRGGISLGAIAKRKALALWVAEQEAQGELINVPPSLLNEARTQHYKDMTVDDFRALRDVVKNLDHVGRLKGKLLAKRKALEFAAVKNELLHQLDKTPKRKASKNINPTARERAKETVGGFLADGLKVEQLVEWMDGGNLDGPWHRYVFDPLADAQVRANDLQVEYTAKLHAVLEKLGKTLADRVYVPEVGYNFTRGEIMAVALNTGNESNLSKMLRGGRDGREWTQDQVDAITDRLTADEWRAVQEIWDTVNSLWPKIAAVQKRLTGVEPPKVEAREITNRHGTFAGGYYPLVYDRRQDLGVDARAEEAADKLFENSYLRPDTAHGFTKERNEYYARPIRLDLKVAAEHVAKVIHDVTHREAIREVYKVVNDPSVSTEIANRFGAPAQRQFVKWLQRIANDRPVMTEADAAQRFFLKARTNVTLFAMGYRATTALTQVVGLSNSMEMVRPDYLAAAVAQVARHPLATWEEISAKSGEMRHRLNNMDRDIRDGIRRLEGEGGVVDDVKRFGFYGIGMADRIVSQATWLGAYNQELAKSGDEGLAVKAGDRAVRLTQGAGGAKDLAAWQADKGLMSLFTMFYSYFNVYFNRLWTLGRDTRSAVQESRYEEFPHLLARLTFHTIIPAVMADLIVGRGPDDDEGYAAWALRKILLYPFMAVPFIRDIASSVESGFGYKLSPLASFGESAVRLAGDVGRAVSGEDVDKRQAAKHAAQVVGYSLGLPLGQAITSADAIWKGLDRHDLTLGDVVLGRGNK